MISAAFWPFLGGAVAVHWLLPVRFRTWFLFVASAAWLTWLDSTIQPEHVPISVPAAVLFGVVFYVVMQRLPTRPPHRHRRSAARRPR